jgi:hypothetical protein
VRIRARREPRSGSKRTVLRGQPTVWARREDAAVHEQPQRKVNRTFSRRPSADGKAWGESVNLGPPVDDPPAGDFALRLSLNEQTLYFSSNRQGGIGSCDVYVARRRSTNQTWDPPENLGPLTTLRRTRHFPPHRRRATRCTSTGRRHSTPRLGHLGDNPQESTRASGSAAGTGRADQRPLHRVLALDRSGRVNAVLRLQPSREHRDCRHLGDAERARALRGKRPKTLAETSTPRQHGPLGHSLPPTDAGSTSCRPGPAGLEARLRVLQLFRFICDHAEV